MRLRVQYSIQASLPTFNLGFPATKSETFTVAWPCVYCVRTVLTSLSLSLSLLSLARAPSLSLAPFLFLPLSLSVLYCVQCVHLLRVFSLTCTRNVYTCTRRVYTCTRHVYTCTRHAYTCTHTCVCDRTILLSSSVCVYVRF